jgi:hypothetical protein
MSQAAGQRVLEACGPCAARTPGAPARAAGARPYAPVVDLQRKAGNAAVTAVMQKNVDDQRADVRGTVVEQAPPKAPPPGPKAPPPPPPKAKTAGVKSFVVKWKKSASAGPTNAALRLDYTAEFLKDADHDPALAEFRQSVMTKYEITAGPHKGETADTSPMHNDNYSRADDTSGHALADVDFVSNDNPGIATVLDKDDVIDYSFTAEDTIIDTSKANAVIARRGPQTGTITGKHPRTYGGVPTTLS